LSSSLLRPHCDLNFQSLFFLVKIQPPWPCSQKQLYNTVHELISMLYNNLYVNGVQAASRSSLGQSCSKFGEVFVLVGSSGPFGVGWMPVPRVTLRVIAVISLDTALVSTFHSQPAELELTTGMPSVIRWVCMGCQQPNRHGPPGPGPRVVFKFCGLQVCCVSLCLQPCMQQVEQGLVHSHNCVQAERPWCRWRPGCQGLAFLQRYNLTCYITWVKSTKMLNSYPAVI
jgi:hypothetical protein